MIMRMGMRMMMTQWVDFFIIIVFMHHRSLLHGLRVQFHLVLGQELRNIDLQ